MLLWLFSIPAMAGYGDVNTAGYPSWAERDVHLWTNIMRVDPDAFFGPEALVLRACDIDDFVGDEVIPKAPLFYDFDLNDAGRFHSQDMYENNHFDHDSSDGTSFGDRIARFYTESGYVGENIAQGYPTAESVLLDGWMCSPGHRANIMNGDYNELGVGVVTNYYTQNFAAGSIQTSSPIAMGNHTPEIPTGPVEFLVDFQGFEPNEMVVIVDGRPVQMFLTYGVAHQGLYTAEMTALGDTDCHEYYFRWKKENQRGTFPEDGSYMFGTECYVDTMWRDGQAVASDEKTTPPPEEDAASLQTRAQDELDGADVDVVGCGCTHNAGTTPRVWTLALLLLGLTIRRQRL